MQIVRKSKKAQIMGMPFQMIFTLILIAIFIVVGFLAIRYVLDWQKNSQAVLFKTDFQNKVTNLWQIGIADDTFTSGLPVQIRYVCFANTSLQNTTFQSTEIEKIWKDIISFYRNQNVNMFYWPFEAVQIDAFKIEHLNLNAKGFPRPFCIANERGKISIHLKIDSGEALVRIVP